MNNEERKKILDDSIKQIRSDQEKELIIDFDQAIESQKKKAITIKYAGHEFKVPGETPVWYMNLVQRKIHELKSVKIDELSEEELIERFSIGDDHNEMIFRRLLGDDFVDEYMKDNFVNWKVLNEELLNPILKKWGWKPVKDTSEKKSLKAVS